MTSQPIIKTYTFRLVCSLAIVIQFVRCSPASLSIPSSTTILMKTKNNTSRRNEAGGSNSSTTVLHQKNDNGSVNSTSSDNKKNDKVVTIMLDGDGVRQKLEMICKVIKVHPSNCTCSNFPSFCNVHKENPASKSCESKSSFEIVEKALVMVISFFGVIGNILVLIVRVRNWKKSLHYRLISGLAIADLTFCCMSLLITVPSLFTCNWKLGPVLCTLLKTFRTMSSNVDLGFILIIAIERYIGIVHPFSGGASACKIYTVVCINLVTGFLAAFPFFLIFRVNGAGQCVEDWSTFHRNASFIYGWISNIFLFLLPIIATAVLYYRGLRTLKSTLFRQEMMLTLDETSRKNLVGENHRILRIISTILLAFLLLVGPNHLAWFIHDNFNVSTLVQMYMFRVSMIVYAVHTSINPIIYSIIDRKFRRNVYFMLRNGRRRKSFTTTATTATIHFSPVHHMQTVVSRVDPEGACSSLGGSQTSSRIIDDHHLDDHDVDDENQDHDRNDVL